MDLPDIMLDYSLCTDTCMLESRHWVIRYASGKEDVVEGEGVIGETPVFFPGHVHQYASCNRFIEEEWCTMEGHFNMRYLSSRRGGLQIYTYWSS